MAIRLLCPYCKSAFGWHWGPHSGLGPAILTCDKTRQLVDTGRKEWAEMHLFRKLWYGLYSLIVALALGMTGIVLVAIVMSARHRDGPRSLDFERFVVYAGFGLCFLLGAAVQAWRVRGSCKRTAVTQGPPRHEAAWLLFSLQALGFLTWVGIVMLTVWLASRSYRSEAMPAAGKPAPGSTPTSAGQIVVGGLYAVKDEDGTYGVLKVLAAEKGIVHLLK